MVTNDRELAITRAQIDYLLDLLAHLRVAPKPERFTRTAARHRAEIERMNREVLDYLTQQPTGALDQASGGNGVIAPAMPVNDATTIQPPKSIPATHPIITERRAELIALCRRFRVRRLDLFGSVAKGTFQPGSSDIDLLVQFCDPAEAGYATRYFGFIRAVEALLGHKVDLITDRPFENPYFQEEIDETRQTIYAADYAEVAV